MDWAGIFEYRNGELVWAFQPSPGIKVGTAAGSKHHSGYVQVYFKGKCYQRSRLVWEMHHGVVPEGFNVDHINAVKYDDRIENLQLLTQSQNVYKGALQTGRSHNRSGYNGVCWHSKACKWMAYITVAGSRKYLGLFDNVEEAAKFREKHEISIDGVIS